MWLRHQFGCTQRNYITMNYRNFLPSSNPPFGLFLDFLIIIISAHLFLACGRLPLWTYDFLFCFSLWNLFHREFWVSLTCDF